MSEASATLHEPFTSATRQREALTFGVWLFLASELLLFAAMFLAYAIYRHAYPTAFAEAGRHVNLLFGTINTALLMTSSLSLSVASRAIDRGQARLSEIGVWITLALGLAFLLTKGLEYREDLHEHLWPGANFALHAPAARIFFGLYWTMTFVHACHMTIGLGLLGRLIWLARRGRLHANHDSVEAATLYWHLVDIIWAMVFACLYLVGR